MRDLKRCLVGLVVGVLSTSTAQGYDLDQHAWRDRLLILAAPGEQHPALLGKRQSVAARDAAVQDRRLRVFVLTGETGYRDGSSLSASDVASLRRAFAIEPDAAVMLLVGLDGEIKRRDSLETSLSELFLEVDAMPMRRAEIRAKRAAGEPVTEP